MKTLARLGQHDAAIDLAKETLRSLEQTDVLDERGEALAASAEVLSLTGAGATAAAHWDEALAMFEAKGNTISAERVRRAAAVFE
jgi:tetratricopeptide (TPR) repeat protein